MVRLDGRTITRERVLSSEKIRNLLAEAFWAAGFYSAAKLVLRGEVGPEEWEAVREMVASHPDRFPEIVGNLAK